MACEAHAQSIEALRDLFPREMGEGDRAKVHLDARDEALAGGPRRDGRAADLLADRFIKAWALAWSGLGKSRFAPVFFLRSLGGLEHLVMLRLLDALVDELLGFAAAFLILVLAG